MVGDAAGLAGGTGARISGKLTGCGGGEVKVVVREAKVGGCRLFSSALALPRFSGVRKERRGWVTVAWTGYLRSTLHSKIQRLAFIFAASICMYIL